MVPVLAEDCVEEVDIDETVDAVVDVDDVPKFEPEPEPEPEIELELIVDDVPASDVLEEVDMLNRQDGIDT
jgi:hypothetical protein